MLKKSGLFLLTCILATCIGCSQKGEVFTIEGEISEINHSKNSITIDKYGELFVDNSSQFHEGQTIQATLQSETSDDVWSADLLKVLKIEVIK